MQLKGRRGNLQRSNYMQDGGSYDYEWLPPRKDPDLHQIFCLSQ